MLSFKTAKLTTEKDSTKKTKATDCKRDRLEEKMKVALWGSMVKVFCTLV